MKPSFTCLRLPLCEISHGKLSIPVIKRFSSSVEMKFGNTKTPGKSIPV